MITGNPKPLRGLGPDHVWSSPKPLSSHRRKVLEFRLSKVGFPIRKSADQSFFAAPHGLSQRSTSFIASQRQGIHRTPLRHLIALIINVHTLGRMHAAPSRREYRGRTLTRKTSLLRKINPMMRRSSFTNKDIYNPLIVTMGERRNILEIVIGPPQIASRIQTRIDLLFTMS